MSTQKPTRPISPLYARYFTAEEKKALRAVPVDDTASEIHLMHVVSAHFMKSQQSAPKDMDSQMQALRTSRVLGEQFAKLIRAYNIGHDPLAELQDEIAQALKELRMEFGI